MLNRAAIAAAIDRCSQLNQAVNRAQDQQQIQDFPSLMNTAIDYNLQAVLKELSKLTSLVEDKALTDAFDSILKEQWKLTQGTALDIFNNPDNATNACLKEVATLIYPGLTEGQLLLKLAPGIKRITAATLTNSAPRKSDFELKTKEITPEALKELSPADRVVAGDAILDASSLIMCFTKLDFIKKIRADLELHYSAKGKISQ